MASDDDIMLERRAKLTYKIVSLIARIINYSFGIIMFLRGSIFGN
jgi:hypothetical protein